MPTVLICGPDRLMDDLRDTMVGRADVDRIHVTGYQQAFGMAVAAHPELVIVDRDMPQAARLLDTLREERFTRSMSIVVAARGDLEPAELKLIDAGANALLRLPGGPETDGRLAQLMAVAPRRAVRLPVRLEVDAFRVTGGNHLSGVATDLSRHGMLVECAPPEVGTEFRFTLHLDDAGGQVTGTCRVIRAAAEDAVGLQFESLDGDGAARIAHHAEG